MSKIIGIEQVGAINEAITDSARKGGIEALEPPGTVARRILGDYLTEDVDLESVILGLEVALVAGQEVVTRAYAASQIDSDNEVDAALIQGIQSAIHVITALLGDALDGTIAVVEGELAVANAFADLTSAL